MAPTAFEPPRVDMMTPKLDHGDESEDCKTSTWEPMNEPEDAAEARRYFFFQEFIKSPETGYVMNAHFEHFFTKQLPNFRVRDDDVYLITFPRSGTTWSQELIWCIANDLDYEGAKEQLVKRFPFLEFDALLPPGGLSRLPAPLLELAKRAQARSGPDATKVTLPGAHLEFIESCPSPRLIKTHLPLCLLPADVRRKKCKIIYVARDSRDVCVSSFHLFRGIGGYTGSLEQYSTNFVKGTAMWGPHWKHVMDHWKLRNDPNLLFLTYEDMKADLLNVIQRISAFLGKKLGPDGEKSLAEHVSFESMKSNEAVAFEKNYAQVTERVLKPVTELGLSLDNLIAIAVDGRMSRVPVGKILKLVVSGKIPLSLVSALVAARLQNRPVRITASQISAMTGGSLTPEFCSDMLEIGGYSAPVPSPDVVVTPKPTSATTTTTTTTTPTSAMTTTSGNKKANKKKTEKSSKPVSSVSVLDANPSPDPAVKPKKRNSGFATNFFRKGVVGDGRSTLSAAQNTAFDDYDKIHFGDSGLPYAK